MSRVLGVLGGQNFFAEDLSNWVASTDFVYAADGGANHLWSAGFSPDAVVGDFDSVELPEVHAAVLHRSLDQNTSDVDKLLAFTRENGHDAITLIGAEGDRLDHTLATLFSSASSVLSVRLVLRTSLAFVFKSGTHSIDTKVGDRVSILPLESCEKFNLSGVKWTLSNEKFSTSRYSLSNIATEPELQIEFVSGICVVFVERTPGEAPIW